jgi:integrating conjugative element protein (TIGR03757 family)
MRSILFIKFLVGFLTIGIAIQACAMQIFTLTSLPLTGHYDPKDVCYVDLSSQLVNGINHAIAGNKAITINDMTSPDYMTQYQKIGDSMQCSWNASLMGITQLPAIVFENNFVIYGQTNVDEALHQFQLFKANHE